MSRNEKIIIGIVIIGILITGFFTIFSCNEKGQITSIFKSSKYPAPIEITCDSSLIKIESFSGFYLENNNKVIIESPKDSIYIVQIVSPTLNSIGIRIDGSDQFYVSIPVEGEITLKNETTPYIITIYNYDRKIN